MNKEHGIIYIEKTFGTRVGLVLINVNKLNPKYVDPEIHKKPLSKHQIILHIGYILFGYKSHEIIKQILMLFGNKAKLLNLIGKCGGLIEKEVILLLLIILYQIKVMKWIQLIQDQLI